MVSIAIIDGYVDEPTCLGVPPYFSPYPRYVAGAIWAIDKNIEIMYYTIDQIRKNWGELIRKIARAKAVVEIAGPIVPGKYVGGTPISLRETKEIMQTISKLSNADKILGGPWGRFGVGGIGGKTSIDTTYLEHYFDVIVSGDIEIFMNRYVESGFSINAGDPTEIRETYTQIEQFIQEGTKIVLQHPNFPKYIILEIETYRGCPRFIVGGCSFCTEPLYGMPDLRSVESITNEIKRLYDLGVRDIRIGRQADIFTYGSKEIGDYEFPTPNPTIIESLFKKIRAVAPNLTTLHIDNVNPGTIAHHPEESLQIAKTIIKYHTPGDVAAMGIESTDPEVIKRNRLKVNANEALEAIKLLNKVGAVRGYNGLPELLPGINLLYGLPGETEKTYELNYEFLKTILEQKLLVRRINIRQVVPYRKTRLWQNKSSQSRKMHSLFVKQKEKIRTEIDLPMLRRVLPVGTIIKRLYSEKYEGKNTLLRQLGSYPILAYLPTQIPLEIYIDGVVIDHGYRSITILQYPINLNKISLSELQKIPGIGKKRAATISLKRPYTDIIDFQNRTGIILDNSIKDKVSFK